MYKNILIPLDNTPTDSTILSHIRALARLTNAHLTLLHVADGFMARNQARFEESAEMQEDRAYLNRRTAELTAEGFAVDSLLLCGDPTEQIIDFATQHACDLIAMATHGHKGLSDMILGSVVNKLRHQTEIPLLLLKAPAKD